MVEESGQLPQIPRHKVVLVGNAGVGKTALIAQFMYNVFEDQDDSTSFGVYQKKILLDGQEVEIKIIDTGGGEENINILNASIRKGDGFLCVFSLVDEDSFKATDDFRAKILRVRNVHIPFILVGNKCDLVEDRQVPMEHVTKKAIQWDVPYVETSAKTRCNVEKVFFGLLRIIAARKLARKTAGQPPKTDKLNDKSVCPCSCCEIS